MRTYMLISALVGLFLTTLGQTVSQSSTIATVTYSTAENQSSTRETIATTSATSDSQSSTSEISAATKATSESQSSTSEISAATSATSATSDSRSSTSETNAPATANVTGPSVNETTGPKDVTTTPAETNITPEITKPTAAPTTSVKQNCTPTICGDTFATCIQLYESYICQCPLKYYFNKTDLSCTRGDNFYGNLQRSTDSFDPKKDSKAYTDLYNEVLNYFRSYFQNDTNFSENYLHTVITDISEMSRTRSIRQSVSVAVSCYNVFKPDTTEEKKVQEAIEIYTESNSFGTYASRNICEGFYCDNKTTSCSILGNNDPICKCLDGYYHTSSSVLTSCNGCDPNCGISAGQQCMLSDDKTPYCGCLPGYYKKETNFCVKCQFGYSGEECTDNSLLILVIVGSVAGAVIIALLGTVIGLSVRSSRRKRDNEMTQLITKDTMESPMAGNLFPKVQAKTDLGYVNRGSSPYDTTDEYPRPTPKRDYDDDPWYEMSRRERRY